MHCYVCTWIDGVPAELIDEVTEREEPQQGGARADDGAERHHRQ